MSVFEQRAREIPQQTAVEFEGQQLSYEALNETSNRLARALQDQGLQPGQLVGIELETGLNLIVSLLAVLKAGACYVPLPPEYPSERKALIKERIQMSLVLGEDNEWELGQYAGHDLEPTLVTDEQVAYIIFTSGSTGQPKGVRITHGSLSRLFPQVTQRLPFFAGERWSQFHSSAFGYSVWEILGALTQGGTLALVPPRLRKEPDTFLTWVRENKINILSLTPTAFRILGLAASSSTMDSWSDLRIVALSGEAIRPRYCKPWIDRFGDAQPEIWSSYALTETGGQLTLHRLTRSDLRFSDLSLLGETLADVQLQLLDESYRPVPQGEPGEIYVSGPMLSPGYLDAAKTRERFLDLPNLPGGLYYRTGDLAMRNHRGQLSFLGRHDRQVKIRGHRIELGEVERLLSSFEGVEDCLVFGREIQGDTRLFAAWVGQDVSQQRLRDYLLALLPEAAIPESFVHLQNLPLDANGKLDPTQVAVSPLLPETNEAVELQDATQELLGVLWSELFQGRRIEPQHDFFELGGHSLLAMKLVASLRNDFEFEVSMSDLVRHSRLEELASVLAGRETEADSTTVASPHLTFMDLAIEQASEGFRNGQAPLWSLHRL